LKLFKILIGRRIVATLSALLVVVLGCSAGVWQLGRAETKIALAAKLAARQQMPILSANAGPWTLEQVSQRRMIARGQFIPEAAIWLDNRPRPLPLPDSASSQSGFYLMMPLRLEGKNEILWINRGWAPRNNQDREVLPPVTTPSGLVSIEGIVFAHPGRVFELGSKPTIIEANKPRIEQNFDLASEATLHQWAQSPFVLREVDTGLTDGLSREWAPLTTGVDRHYAYAFQWFALAGCGFLFWLLTGLRQYWKHTANEEQ
jgi:surfeit locus 1 family protein